MQKRVLMIVAQQDFRVEEFSVPKKILEDAGVIVDVASQQQGTATGYPGDVVVPVSLALEAVEPEIYEGIVFVGGRGSHDYFDSKTAHRLAKTFYLANKITSAICAAVVIFARAGILAGKNATCFPSYQGDLILSKALYSSTSTARDGNIITGSGPDAAKEFGELLVEALGQ